MLFGIFVIRLLSSAWLFAYRGSWRFVSAYFLRMGRGRVFSGSAVLSSVPLEDSKKSDVSVSVVSEESVVSSVFVVSVCSVVCVLSGVVADSELFVVWVVRSVVLVSKRLGVVCVSGLVLPQPERAKTAQNTAADTMKSKNFFIFIL